MRRFGIVAIMAVLGACASAGTKFDPAIVDSLTPGMTIAEVDAKLGKPNGETFAADGRRIQTWVYSQANALTGSSNARSVGILFDADGRMVRVVTKSQSEGHSP